MSATRTCSSCGHSVSAMLDRCPQDGTPFFSDEVMSRVGVVLHDHEIQGVIGEGGMGVVYRAQHVVIEKPVAIKVLHDRFARQKEMVEQFIVEAKAASRIRHPNIIDVTDFGTTPEGLVFLIMEYLDGESLQERLGRVRRLPVFDAVNIMKQVARGLGAAHELGIVHRDLKPANIFLCQREGRRRIVRRTSGVAGPEFVIEPEDKFDLVKLLDFGVAKFMDLGPSAATRAGMLCGTPLYLSPEQAQEQPATERSDIYSLGAVFYEMVTGKVPFDGSSMFEILKGHVVGTLVPPSRCAPGVRISPQVDALIGRCMEKDPARRFANTDRLLDALSECVGDRAFLRDAHRLPGIASSGLDLSEGTADARKGAERGRDGHVGLAPSTAEPTGVDNELSTVEMGREWADLAEIEERPDRHRRRDRRDTLRISTRHTRRTALVVLVLLLGVGGALWALRDRLGLFATRAGSGTASSAGASPVASQPEAVAARPAAGQPAPAVAPAPAAATVVPAAELAGPKTGGKAGSVPGEVAGNSADKLTEHAGDKGATHARAALAGLPRSRPGMSLPADIPIPAMPTPPPAPAPIPAPAPAEPAVDVEGLLRDAQQAWSRRYYGVAIDKARAVLKATPGRHDAYQIIAVCSCATGAADDAREAMSHLDLHKQKLVQTLCRNQGVDLE